MIGSVQIASYLSVTKASLNFQKIHTCILLRYNHLTDSLGNEYGEARILDLEATWKESDPQAPLICILSIGSDPSPQITALAKAKDIRKYQKIRKYFYICVL